jgi:mono/diheme cytochrome c family protein
MTHRLLALKLAVILVVLINPLSGCRSDMQNQPKMLPLRHTSFFADGRSGRQQVAGTVARSQADQDHYFLTGMQSGGEGNAMPFRVNYAILQRGQEQFNIYCSPCHSRVGNGKGAVVARGYHSAANLQSERLQSAALGHIFKVITQGYGAMPSYSAQITPANRWAIVAYVRALQLSQHATLLEVPASAKIVAMATLLQNDKRPERFLDVWDVYSANVQSTTDSPSAATGIFRNRNQSDEHSHGLPSTSAIPVSKQSKGVSLLASISPRVGEAPQEDISEKENTAHGKEIYMEQCSICHQPNRSGVPPQIPSLIAITNRVGEERIRHVVKAGIPDASPPMPPHPNLSESDTDDLIAFLHMQ